MFEVNNDRLVKIRISHSPRRGQRSDSATGYLRILYVSKHFLLFYLFPIASGLSSDYGSLSFFATVFVAARKGHGCHREHNQNDDA